MTMIHIRLQVQVGVRQVQTLDHPLEGSVVEIVAEVAQVAAGKGPYADSSLRRSIYLNGQKWGGVHTVKLDYDMNKMLTMVHLSFAVKKNGIKVSRKKIEIQPFVCK
jgi:hypothetical protein